MAKKGTQQLKKKCGTAAVSFTVGTLNELLRVYHDLEKTIKGLRSTAEKHMAHDSCLSHINLKKLISQLSRSKKKIERKLVKKYGPQLSQFVRH